MFNGLFYGTIKYLLWRNFFCHSSPSYYHLRPVQTAGDAFWKVSFDSDDEVNDFPLVTQKRVSLN